MRFRELAQACSEKSTELFTYTYSTSVRAAMLAAGFYVAKGACHRSQRRDHHRSVGARGGRCAWPRVVGTGMAGEVAAQRCASSLRQHMDDEFVARGGARRIRNSRLASTRRDRPDITIVMGATCTPSVPRDSSDLRSKTLVEADGEPARQRSAPKAVCCAWWPSNRPRIPIPIRR